MRCRLHKSSADQATCDDHNKKGRSTNERPKSREETPIVGHGNGETLRRDRKLTMSCFATLDNSTTCEDAHIFSDAMQQRHT